MQFKLVISGAQKSQTVTEKDLAFFEPGLTQECTVAQHH